MLHQYKQMFLLVLEVDINTGIKLQILLILENEKTFLEGKYNYDLCKIVVPGKLEGIPGFMNFELLEVPQ